MKFSLVEYILSICFLISTFVVSAQEVRVVDNKGTIKKIRNNNVYTSNTDPTGDPVNDVLMNDVWFDTSEVNNTVTKIYDGSNWILVNKKIKSLQDADGDTKVSVEKNFDEDFIRFETKGVERMQINDKGNVGIGNNSPNSEAILDLTNTKKFAFLLPSETETTKITTPAEGMLIHATNKKNTYLRTDNKWKPIAYNKVTNELIFDGSDDIVTTNDNFYYVSFIVNGNWKVIRYNKTDVNMEDTTDKTSNPSQTSQPTTLAECTALTF